jgi:hypothetical protein
MTLKDHALQRLDELIGRGRDLQRGSTARAGDGIGGVLRVWQRDCAAAVSDLSGGSKAHWLSRAYSRAFLLAAPGAGVVVEASPGEIVDRIVAVLAEARAALAAADASALAAPAPAARRFDFVHDPQLGQVLEAAYGEASRAFDAGDYRRALVTWSGMLEAAITDALQHGRPAADQSIAGSSFEARIEAAQAAGIISAGCGRLPVVARRYREEAPADVSERDARIVRQVLQVTMRDLDPGR